MHRLFARLQYYCAFVFEIKDQMQYCMEEPNRGCWRAVLSASVNNRHMIHPARGAAAQAGVITKNARLHLFSNLRNGDFTTYRNRHHTVKKNWCGWKFVMICLEVCNLKIDVFHSIPVDFISAQSPPWNSDLSNMAELLSFSRPTSESTPQCRTSPLRQARMRPKVKAAPVYI